MIKRQSDPDTAGVEVGHRRLARLYAVLSQVNEAIVRTRDEQALFAEVCRIVAEQGEFPLAWIGLVKERAVVPAASCGPEAVYLAEIRVEVEGELGMGPTGTCIREDRPVVNDDFATNTNTAPWRQPALGHGFRASAAFPFHKDEKPIGALTLYAGRPGAFDPAQVGLLKALCADLSYALAAIADERRRSEAEQALRDSEARYRAFFENLQELVAVCEAVLDNNGKVADLLLLDANDRHLETFGLKREDVIGRRVSAVFGQEAVGEKLDLYSQVMATGRPISYENHFRGRVFSVTLFRIDGKTLAQTGTDITERRRAEEALRTAYAQLVEDDKRKNEFLAVLSHELRNPLAPIKNSLYILGRSALGSDQARRAQAVIARQVGHMGRLIDDLLDVSRVSQGKIQLQRRKLEFGQLVRRTVEDHRATYAAAGIQLDCKLASEPMWLTADSTRLAQVVGNLLGNAVKFTPRGGRVELTLEPQDRAALLCVRDTGVGMTAAVIERIFQPFVQAEETLDRSHGGLGIGLALVKGLVELHGGSVGAASEGPGRGAEFTIKLPLEDAPEQPTPAPHERPVSPRRILVIEDNVDAADSLKEALELSGHQVQVAYNGPEGITKARQFRPDVVLSDVGLPGMDGYQVARAFRADATLKTTFLVAITGYASPEDTQRATEAGFQRHLAKPLSLQALEDLLAAPESETGLRVGGES